ncbi:mucin-5AC-like [Cydia amplana]|uniref:mucin-5AC-like n=1 Tax=Cydia amplana TaxID=1869771 RepID=UPI002FE57BB2
MRRQARISCGGALIGRSASALQVWLWLLIYVFQNEFRISRSIEPGYLDFDNLPETNFTCAGKVIGGYYADLETSCQMFHVCTVGQQEEPMDIKFLCLNGTVFDQETRVCERVDEVDCTKSEKFYSLNLELYGSTLAPPVIQPEQSKPQGETTEQTNQQTKPSKTASPAPAPAAEPAQSEKTHIIQAEVEDSTEDPVLDTKKEEHQNKNHYLPTSSGFTSPEHEEVIEENQEEDEFDSENPDYDDDYSPSTTTTFTHAPTTSTTTTTTTTTTTRKPQPTATFTPSSLFHHQLPSGPYLNPSQSPPLSSLSPPSHASSLSSASASPTSDPSLLSPQEFIYRHRGPGSEAISFQRQSFRPADGVFITHAPPHQFDHFQYESSRTAPRPVPFVQKPQPFRPTTLDPRDQLLRPGPTSQSSERHEMAVKHKQQPQTYLSLPAQRPLPFDPFYYERKRSDESVVPDSESTLSARSVAPPHAPQNKPKSPPRVIVTASASVSDSNGKRLNYTVGNVVSAVKPIVPINYDDYKESDLIFDPFFLDVPKLQKRRKTRSNQKRRIFTVPATATVSSELVTNNHAVTKASVTSRATTTDSRTTTVPTTTTTAAWNPNDYVDDNYEPHAYVHSMPPLAIFHYERQKHDKHEGKPNKDSVTVKNDNVKHDHRLVFVSRPTSSVAQTTSSQSIGAGAAPPAASPPPQPPLEAPTCAFPGTTDCRTHA